jgi:hypothetical protein
VEDGISQITVRNRTTHILRPEDKNRVGANYSLFEKLNAYTQLYTENNFQHTTYKETKLRDLSPRANYTDRATAACRPS